MMKIPSSIRYSLIKRIVYNLLKASEITSLPVDIEKINSHIKKNIKCRLIPYSMHMKKFNLTITEMIRYADSKDGCTDYSVKKDSYLIYYNDININESNRIRWTIAHELGHVMLGHHKLSDKTRIFRSKLSDKEYGILESEANYFASSLFAPPIILNALEVKSASDIQSYCQLSNEASINRFNSYKKWKANQFFSAEDIKVIALFFNFIHSRMCTKCNYTFIADSNTNFCPICGNNKLIRGDGKMKYKEGVPLYDDGHAKICPRCDNEDVSGSEAYCKICGAYLIQECSGKTAFDVDNEEYVVEPGCNVKLTSNARYCTVCGRTSTFYKYDYLKSWSEEKNEIENEQQQSDFESTTLINDDSIPF
ncbi:ImmA/IrrE family metallo-endopeptidase [Oxobacter pfennigii]|nr:ImmA/IrrE family metallo-endopeptidase [Oxobacter pfennigii]